MFIKTEKVNTYYTRQSKLGTTHEYCRAKTIVHLQCDNCDTVFTRDLKKINRTNKMKMKSLKRYKKMYDCYPLSSDLVSSSNLS